MLLVVARDSKAREALSATLTARSKRPTLSVDDPQIAAHLCKLNPVDAVVFDFRGGVFKGQDAAPLDLPASCFVLCGDTIELGTIAPWLPATSTALPSPIDWQVLLSRIGDQIDQTRRQDGEVVASGLEEILRLLAMTKAQARVEVLAEGKRGLLWVRKGDIVHAERGARTGEEVACEIVTWKHARVRTRRLDVPPLSFQAMQLPISALLHEGARRQDELLRLSTLDEVRHVLDDLERLAGMLFATLVDVDNEKTLATRGKAELLLDFGLVRHVLDATGARQQTSKPQLSSRGAVYWSTSLIRILVPINCQLTLYAGFRPLGNPDRLRQRCVDAAAALANIAQRRITGTHRALVANETPW